MIRFIDLRGQGTQCRFTFWSTAVGRFMLLGGEQAWSTWDEFAQAVADEPEPTDETRLARLRGLCPEWVFQPDDDSHEDKFWGFDGPEADATTVADMGPAARQSASDVVSVNFAMTPPALAGASKEQIDAALIGAFSGRLFDPAAQRIEDMMAEWLDQHTGRKGWRVEFDGGRASHNLRTFEPADHVVRTTRGEPICTPMTRADALAYAHERSRLTGGRKYIVDCVRPGEKF